MEAEPIRRGHAVTFRGEPWSRNCRESVYFDRVLPIAELRARFPPEACVTDHEFRGTCNGEERGLVCTAHRDALMGRLPREGETESTGGNR